MFVLRNSAPPVTAPPSTNPTEPPSTAPPPATAPPAAPVQFTSGDAPNFGSASSLYATANGSPRPSLAKAIADSIGGGLKAAGALGEADAVVDVVGDGVFDVYGPGGSVKVAGGLRGNEPGDFGFLRSVILNAPTLADLVSLSSPGGGMQLQLRAAGVADTRSSKISTRTVKVSVNTGPHRLDYYEPGQARTRSNSLQLEVVSSEDCYLTIASLNSAGEVYLLLPNAGQELSGFLSKGRIPASGVVLIPDSLAERNRAGFHFDYAPPGGTDRVIGICMREIENAERLRAQIAKLELGGTLDSTLFATTARGLSNVTPGPASQPSNVSPVPQSAGAGDWAASILTLKVGSQ